MSSKRPSESIALEKNTSHEVSTRTYDRIFIPQSWNAFQRMRCSGDSSTTVVTRPQHNLRAALDIKETPKTNGIGNYKNSLSSRKLAKEPCKNVVKLPPVKRSSNSSRWARSWANHRAQQTLLTRSSSKRWSSTPRDESNFVKCHSVQVTHPRSRGVELDVKAAEMFDRLRSIYLNKEERSRRLQTIRERMDEFQKRSVRNEVNKSIQEFNMKMKEDQNNRKELRRVRERFSETKKCRLKTMHMSLNALEVPAVPRLAYGLPQEGKEFSVPFSSKKTTDEIKKMWQMAIVRKNCIDSFLNKVSQRHQDLPDITVKTIKRGSAIKNQISPTAVQELPVQHYGVIEKSKELTSQSELANPNHKLSYEKRLIKMQSGLLESLESLSSDEEFYES